VQRGTTRPGGDHGESGRDLSNTAARIGDLRKRMEAMPSLQGREAVMEFMARIEEFERRRQALRQDLDKMVRGSGE
jgi:hypothetical protein